MRHTPLRRCPLCGIDHPKRAQEAASESSFWDGCRLRLGELTGAKSRLFKQEARIRAPAEAADPPGVGPEYCRLNAGCLPVRSPDRPDLPLQCRWMFAACRPWSEPRQDCDMRSGLPVGCRSLASAITAVAASVVYREAV